MHMKLIMKILPLASMLLLGISACSQSKHVTVHQVTTQEVNDGLTRFNFFYPKTVFNFTVESIKETFIPGPYAQFSEKYIGVPASDKGSTSRRIAGVTVSHAQEPDYSRMFAVEGTPNEVAKVFDHINDSKLFPASEVWLPNKVSKEILEPQVFSKPIFTDLGADPFIATEKNTYYSRVPVDSGFIRVPVQKNVIVETNLEDRAKAAADFLFSIRKRRFDLITGETDHAIDGKAIEVSVAELNKLENAYLSLFVGKIFVDTVAHHFSYVPTSAPNQNAILFRFSEQQGILANDDLSGRPIMLELASDSTLTAYKNLTVKPSASSKGTVLFPYILPEIAQIEMYDGKSELLKSRVPVCQLGQIQFFPVSLWK